MIISVVVLFRSLPIGELLDLVQQRVDMLGAWGPLVFGLAYFAASVLFVPGSALTLASGAIFGLGVGFITVSLSSTTAAAMSFLIARHLARRKVETLALRHRTFGAIDRAIAQGGWRIIALLRLSPAVPFSVGNYLYGLTPVAFWPYVLASWIAMMPGTFLYVYLGYIGRTAAGAGTGQGAASNPWQYVLLVAGLAATIVVTVYVTRLARKALKETAMSEDHEHDASPSDDDASARHASTQGASSSVPVKLLVIAGAMAVLAACTHYNRSRLSTLFGPPRAVLQEAYADAVDGAAFDHALFDALLKKYVTDQGLVDYDALAGEASQLDEYIARIGRFDIDTLGRNERLALLINAYNAMTLRLVLDYMPVESIKNIPAAKRWDARRWTIDGETYSLNQIEHELIRPKFAEPRVHFALVCAAIGCPPLRREAYTGDRLESQLADQARIVHTNERWFRLDVDRGDLYLTALYDWYGNDFRQVASSVTAYAAQFSPELVGLINAGREVKVRFLDYDWSLNSTRRIDSPGSR